MDDEEPAVRFDRPVAPRGGDPSELVAIADATFEDAGRRRPSRHPVGPQAAPPRPIGRRRRSTRWLPTATTSRNRPRGPTTASVGRRPAPPHCPARSPCTAPASGRAADTRGTTSSLRSRCRARRRCRPACRRDASRAARRPGRSGAGGPGGHGRHRRCRHRMAGRRHRRSRTSTYRRRRRRVGAGVYRGAPRPGRDRSSDRAPHDRARSIVIVPGPQPTSSRLIPGSRCGSRYAAEFAAVRHCASARRSRDARGCRRRRGRSSQDATAKRPAARCATGRGRTRAWRTPRLADSLRASAARRGRPSRGSHRRSRCRRRRRPAGRDSSRSRPGRSPPW